MKKFLLILSCFLLPACEQQVTTPGPVGGASVKTTETAGTQAVSMTSKDGEKAKENEGKNDNEGNKVEKSETGDEPEKVGRMELSEEEWKKRLSPEEYYILRQKGTERAFTGKYDKFYKPGRYLCAGCDLELFTSDTKFDSGCGWPAFYAAKAGDRVKMIRDLSAGMVRTEVVCARCDGHLGHVFENEGYSKDLVPTGQRYCINSVAIKFVPADVSKGVKREDAAAPAPEK